MANGETGTTVIGSQAKSRGSNTIVIGNSSNIGYYVYGTPYAVVGGVDYRVGTIGLVSITNTVTLTAAANANKRNVISGSNSFTATAPSAVGFVNEIPIKISSAYTGVFYLATVSSQTIDGTASPQKFFAGESFTLFSDGTNWMVF